MNKESFVLNEDYLKKILLELLAIPCPTGFTDRAVVYVCEQLKELEVPFELMRRGTIRAKVPGTQGFPGRAVVTHLDTIGAMVREIKPNGRLAITPVGHWSSRFSEGARVTIFSDERRFRGSVLPLMAAGHAFNEAIDSQPVTWDQVEIRVDEPIKHSMEAEAAGIQVGDFVAFDPNPEFLSNGYIVSRHLDNKAGVACVLTALKTLRDYNLTLPFDCFPIFTLSEEVGSGANHALIDDITEFVGVDIGPVANGQNAQEFGVTVAIKDSSGPFDYHLTHHLLDLCKKHGIPHQRDVFRFYYSDAISAVQAGHDIRHALITFGTDATHGYERTHMSALNAVTQTLIQYMLSQPTVSSDRLHHATLSDFTHQLATNDIPLSEGTHLPDPKKLF